VKASTSDTKKAGTEKPAQEVNFKDVRGRKRQSTTESAPTSKKAAAAAGSTPSDGVATQNFFAPLRATVMDIDPTGAKATTREEAVPGKAGRPPR
jgi:hypothetical protein